MSSLYLMLIKSSWLNSSLELATLIILSQKENYHSLLIWSDSNLY